MRRRQPQCKFSVVHVLLVMACVAGLAPALFAQNAPVSRPGSEERDPLPSWNAGATRTAIVDFVHKVTTPGPACVPREQRIAVFDNDGTMWCEQGMYPQFRFGMDRVQALAAAHPEWRTEQPYKAALENDTDAVLSSGVNGMIQLTAGVGAGLTPAEFDGVVTEWLATARHPRFDRRFTELVYQPMLELLAWLRANGFKTYVVTGGGADFVRPWAERVYGVPPEQVIGSDVKMKFELRGSTAALVRLPEIDSVDDKEHKALNIQKFIGRQPILAFGNSNADLPMLEWTTAGQGVRFAAFVHHTDAVREYAYDRQAKVGRLDHGLDEARRRGWILVDMRTDWRVMFPPEHPNPQ